MSHNGLVRCLLGRTTVAGLLGFHYGLIRGCCVARCSDRRAKSMKLSDQNDIGSQN